MHNKNIFNNLLTWTESDLNEVINIPLYETEWTYRGHISSYLPWPVVVISHPFKHSSLMIHIGSLEIVGRRDVLPEQMLPSL